MGALCSLTEKKGIIQETVMKNNLTTTEGRECGKADSLSTLG